MKKELKKVLFAMLVALISMVIIASLLVLVYCTKHGYVIVLGILLFGLLSVVAYVLTDD